MSKDWQKEQLAFMEACGQNVFKLNDWLNQQRPEKRQAMLDAILLYSNLIYEETSKELLGAMDRITQHMGDHKDEAFWIPSDSEELAEIFDGCIDSIYVILGLMNCFGFPAPEGWEEVQKANMAKRQAHGKVERREDGKILKPEGWQEPNMIGILDDQLARDHREAEPWQAKMAQALVRMNSLTRNTEKIDMAIKDYDIPELIRLNDLIMNEKLAFGNAISEALMDRTKRNPDGAN
jgi:hypothetical protein